MDYVPGLSVIPGVWGKFEIYSFRQLETTIGYEAREHAMKCPFRKICLMMAYILG